MAPEHVHEADAQHAYSVTHHHLEAHDDQQTEIEQGEGHVLWLTPDVALQYTTYHVTPGYATVPTAFLRAPSCAEWKVATTLDGAPPHGPPRLDTPLRAPPPLSA
jgi:hypothetical protein